MKDMQLSMGIQLLYNSDENSRSAELFYFHARPVILSTQEIGCRRGRNYGVLDRSNISTTIIQLVKDTGELTLSLDRHPAVEPIDFRYSAAFYASCL